MEKNIRIFAENASINNTELPGFNIFLDFSGERHFVCWHRHDGLLYGLLSDGIRVEELGRLSTRQLSNRCIQRKKTNHLIKSVARLNMVISEYIEEYERFKRVDRAAREAHSSTCR